MIAVWIGFSIAAFVGFIIAVSVVLAKQTARIARESRNYWELRDKINALEEKADWEPPKWTPPTVQQLAAELIPQIDSYKPRCPNCNVIIVQKNVKFCPVCGHPFDKTPPSKLPRILATYVEDHKPHYNKPAIPTAYIKWQCLECGVEQLKSWTRDDIVARRPFIHVLECSKCKRDVGDVIVDPRLLTLNQTWAVGLKAHGELRLDDYTPSQPEPSFELAPLYEGEPEDEEKTDSKT
jgi:hypothetical protein